MLGYVKAKVISSMPTERCTNLSKSGCICHPTFIHCGWGAVALLATGSWPKKISWPLGTDIFTARRPTVTYLVTCAQESHRLKMDEKVPTRGDPDPSIHPSIQIT